MLLTCLFQSLYFTGVVTLAPMSMPARAGIILESHTASIHGTYLLGEHSAFLTRYRTAKQSVYSNFCFCRICIYRIISICWCEYLKMFMSDQPCAVWNRQGSGAIFRLEHALANNLLALSRKRRDVLYIMSPDVGPRILTSSITRHGFRASTTIGPK